MTANAEMIEGYNDGRDLDAPAPSANRSHSYRHGFEVGRADRSGAKIAGTCSEIRERADAAMIADAER